MLAVDLAGFLGRSSTDVRERLTERNWRRIALLYERLLGLLDEGATYFARAHRVRRNPEWAPGRPIRAELKLARINAKVDTAERQLRDALDIPPAASETGSRDPLSPRSPIYLVPLLEEEVTSLEVV